MKKHKVSNNIYKMGRTDEFDGDRSRHDEWVGYIFMWIQLRGGRDCVQVLIGICSPLPKRHRADGVGLVYRQRVVQGGCR